MKIIPVAKSVVIEPKKLKSEGLLDVEINCAFNTGTVKHIGSGVDGSMVDIKEEDLILYIGGRELPNGQWIVQEREIYAKIGEEGQ